MERQNIIPSTRSFFPGSEPADGPSLRPALPPGLELPEPQLLAQFPRLARLFDARQSQTAAPPQVGFTIRAMPRRGLLEVQMCVPSGVVIDQIQYARLLAAAVSFLWDGKAPPSADAMRASDRAELDARVATLNLVACLAQHSGKNTSQLKEMLIDRKLSGRIGVLFDPDTGILRLQRSQAGDRFVASLVYGTAVDAEFAIRIESTVGSLFALGWSELGVSVLKAVLPHCQWHVASIGSSENAPTAWLYNFCVTLMLRYPAFLEDEGTASEWVGCLTKLGPAPDRHRQEVIGPYGNLAEKLAQQHPDVAATLVEHMLERNYEVSLSVDAWKSIFVCAVRLGRTDLAQVAINALVDKGRGGERAVAECERILANFAFPNALQSPERDTLAEHGFTFKIRHAAGGLLGFVPDEGVQFDPNAHGEPLLAFVEGLVVAADDIPTGAVALSAVEFVLMKLPSLPADLQQRLLKLVSDQQTWLEKAILRIGVARADPRLMLRFQRLVELDLLTSLLERIKGNAQGGPGSHGTALQLARWLLQHADTFFTVIPAEQFGQMFDAVCAGLFSIQSLQATGNEGIALAELNSVAGRTLGRLDTLFRSGLWLRFDAEAPLFVFWQRLAGPNHLPCHVALLMHANRRNLGTIEQWHAIQVLVDEAFEVVQTHSGVTLDEITHFQRALIDLLHVVVRNSVGQSNLNDVLKWAQGCLDRQVPELGPILLLDHGGKAITMIRPIERIAILITGGHVEEVVQGFNDCDPASRSLLERRCYGVFVAAIVARCDWRNFPSAIQLFILRTTLIAAASGPPVWNAYVGRMIKIAVESLRQDEPGSEHVLVQLLKELYASNAGHAIDTLNSILAMHKPPRTSPVRRLTIRQAHPTLGPRVHIEFARLVLAQGRTDTAVRTIQSAMSDLEPEELERAQELFDAFFETMRSATVSGPPALGLNN